MTADPARGIIRVSSLKLPGAGCLPRRGFF